MNFKVGDTVVCTKIPVDRDEYPVFTNMHIGSVGLEAEVLSVNLDLNARNLSTVTVVHWGRPWLLTYLSDWLTPCGDALKADDEAVESAPPKKWRFRDFKMETKS